MHSRTIRYLRATSKSINIFSDPAYNKTTRLEVAKNHQKWDVEKWRKVLFSDETFFSVDDPNGSAELA